MPTTTQSTPQGAANATPSASFKEQIATCTKVRSIKTKSGEKDVGIFQLNDGQSPFEVWESEYFKFRVNETFRPVIVVLPSAYNNKEGVARANMKPFVNWLKVGG